VARKLKTTRFDSAAHLNSAKAVDAYMADALDSNDPAVIAHALGTIARARGMSRVAKKAGLSRESLYKALGPSGNPELGTIIRVMRALGLKLSATSERRNAA